MTTTSMGVRTIIFGHSSSAVCLPLGCAAGPPLYACNGSVPKRAEESIIVLDANCLSAFGNNERKIVLHLFTPEPKVNDGTPALESSSLKGFND